jgi:hypothetical protein
MSKGIEGKILVVIMELVFLVIILVLFSGLVGKALNLMVEGLKIMLCGLLNWFVQELGLPFKICVV